MVSADLGDNEARRARGAVLLRDNEWGIVGKVDLVLEGPYGLVPVEYKSAGASFEPGKAKPSQVIQLATALVLCEGDGRLGTRPAEGWLRYVDDQGRILPGGEIKVPNTPQLRDHVKEIARRMRRALITQEPVHRSHRSAAKCGTCSLRMGCDEALI
ncbi:MAG: PD-(D/E)XK nuclease family protein [Candidatus Methylomirabilales bacterium]